MICSLLLLLFLGVAGFAGGFWIAQLLYTDDGWK